MVDKRARFVELAEKRVNRTLESLRLIGNLSNRRNYQYTDEDARKIITALDEELKALKKRFALQGVGDKPRFKL